MHGLAALQRLEVRGELQLDKAIRRLPSVP